MLKIATHQIKVPDTLQNHTMRSVTARVHSAYQVAS